MTSRSVALVRDIAASKGISLAQLARRAGIPKQSVYNTLAPGGSVDNRPRRATLEAFADALDIDPAPLLIAAGYDADEPEMSREAAIVASIMAQLDADDRETLVKIARALS